MHATPGVYQQVKVCPVSTEVYVPVCTREGRGGPSGPPRPYGLPVWVPAGQGTSPGHGSFTIWLLQNHKLTKRSGRRAPILEGGGHSCLFVSSDGDAARECASINQSTEIVRYQEHLGGLLGGSPIPHSMHGNPSKCSLLIPFRIPDGIQYASRSLNRLIVGPLGRVLFHPCFLELLDIRI